MVSWHKPIADFSGYQTGGSDRGEEEMHGPLLLSLPRQIIWAPRSLLSGDSQEEPDSIRRRRGVADVD